ncbi:hypothetical protein IQ268_08745 [Oculatella sp. LEGE 06141]|uniref:hypothetical protein n=1 Tax=Oculatella sp. LEGE 06141 TaxID=1828648 RepID=UPI0018810600|nr:hypothetical protein [Oculatella sp. LEGE 06141]MBE9178646.1 hypothetical protein [Oculatella sp. LEGE 06141]
MNAIDLLGTWGKLEPDQYKAWVERSQGMDDRAAQAELLQTLLEAIASSESARVRLENSSQGWHATLGKRLPDSNSFQFLVFAKDPDPALALLTAWVEFLEKAAIASEVAQ